MIVQTLPSLVYAFLFLVPGFLAFKMVIRYGNVYADFDKFDKTAFSVLGSGISFVLFLVIVNFWAIICGNDISIPTILNSNASEAIVGLVAISLIAILGGIIFGKGINEYYYSWKGKKGEPTFNVAFDNAKEKEEGGIEIFAIMDNGREIKGYLRAFNDEKDKKDIILKHPKQVIRSGESEKRFLKLGKSVYLSGSKISEIHFRDGIDFEWQKD